MSFSVYGIWISLLLIALCGVFFFFNKKPKFLVPISLLQKNIRRIYRILVVSLLVSVVLLPLRISFVSDKQILVQKDLPIQILLDVSLSMASNDLSPSRFVAAKTSLISLVRQLDWYYISLIAFSGKPFVYIPFSFSSSAIIAKLETMNLGDFPPVKDFLGTAIGDALLLGIQNLQQMFQQEIYKPWIVVLITDGDSNVWFDPVQIIAYYKKMNVPLFVLGVWQENFLIGRDTWNADIVTDINLPLLQQLADAAWWSFYRILNDQSFDEFFYQFSQNILDQQQTKIQNIYRELNDYLIYLLLASLLGVGAFIVASLLPQKKYNTKTTK